MEAAAHWCRGGAPDPEAQRLALRGLGIPDEVANEMTPQQEAAAFAVWPENRAALNAFIAMGSQWLHDIMGRRYALRYDGLPAIMDMLGISPADRAEAFAGVHTCERAALDYWTVTA